MLVAKLKTGAKVMAQDAQKLSDTYFCPACENEVRLRRGYVKIDHFFHKRACSCNYAGESILHITMKQQIFEYLKISIGSKVKFIELEKPLGTIRPDVYIETNKSKIGIEVQASSLTPEEILYRTSKYHMLDIHVLWVLPFDKLRYYRYDSLLKRDIPCSFRLKEYERIVSEMYDKTMVLWDFRREPTDGFIVFKLIDSYTDASDYYTSDGDYMYHEPKPLKMKREIDKVVMKAEIIKFICQKKNQEQMRKADYKLPYRLLFMYNWAK